MRRYTVCLAARMAPPELRAAHWNDELERIERAFAETARVRDLRGGTPHEERTLLRQSGLLTLTIGAQHGGQGESFGTLLEVVQRIARVDSSLAHVFAFHHLMLSSLQLFGSSEQWGRAHEETVRDRLFWGNALNPKDTRARLTRAPQGYLLSGEKSFCSGARDSDRLLVSAIEAETGKLVILVVPTRREGIETLDDWDAFGQRQTDSGSVIFREVQVSEEEILRSPGPLTTPRSSLRPCLAQAILAHVYLGIAEGAWSEVNTLGTQKLGTRAEDPYVLLRAGELSLLLEGARALAERARVEIDRALSLGDAIDERERGLLALGVARAKASSTHVGLAVAQGIFEILGPRATSASRALDRYWRNIRVHTLHDPVDHKLREIGAFELTGELPSPSFYS